MKAKEEAEAGAVARDEALAKLGLDNPCLFAASFDAGDELRDDLLGLLIGLDVQGESPADTTARLDALERLHLAARAGAQAAGKAAIIHLRATLEPIKT